MGGAVAIATASEPGVERVVGLAPWIPDQLGLETLRGRRFDVLHGSLDRYLPGFRRLGAASRRGFDRARSLGVEASYTLIRVECTALLYAAARRDVSLPRARAWLRLSPPARALRSNWNREASDPLSSARVIGFRPFFSRLYRVELLGVERIPLEGAHPDPNHESMIDRAARADDAGPIRFMAKAELWDIPGVRWVMEKFGTFPVARGTGDRQAFGRAEQFADRRRILGIFPQGTCLPFRTGAGTAGPRSRARDGSTDRARLHRRQRTRAPSGQVQDRVPRVVVLVGNPIEVAQAKPTLAAAKELTSRIERRSKSPRAVRAPAHACSRSSTPPPENYCLRDCLRRTVI